MAAAEVPVKHAPRIYLIEFTLVTALYVGTVLVRPWLVAHAGSEPLVFVAKVLPGIPVWLMLLVAWRQYARIDEYARKRLLETITISFGIASCAMVTYVFLIDAGLPKLSIAWAWPALGAVWLLTAGIRGIVDRG